MRTAPTLRDAARPHGLLGALGSPRLTLVLLPLLGLAVVAVGRSPGATSAWLAAPLAALAANLAASIATRPAFRAQPWLLAFHAALLAVVLLAALGRLVFLQGTLELSQGEEFTGELLQSERGPLHRDTLAQARFTNVDFTVDYEPGVKRGHTANLVEWRADDGSRGTGVVGDDAPLRLAGYRFYTTSNKGFAPELTWEPRAGGAVRGTVHLPSYPAQLAEQHAAWVPPGEAVALDLRLRIEQRLIDVENAWRLELPSRHRLLVESAGVRAELLPGQSVELPQGTLRYERLRLWMGYLVSHDPTQPWLVAASLVAAGCLAAHLAQRYRGSRWHGSCERIPA